MTNRRLQPFAFLALFTLAIVLVAAACGGSSTATSASEAVTTVPDSVTTATSATEWEFTLAELADFDGKEGRPAYVAVDGVVYDVSDSSRWPQGTHSSCNLGASAGQDLSDVIRQAPASMRSLMEQMPVVGSLAP